MTNLAVDVLVVNYRTPALTRAAVTAVTGPGVQVWVWDNSGDVAEDALPAGALLYGDGDNHWFAAANNALLRKGDAPFVLLLNPDVTLPHRDLQVMLRRLVQDPHAWGCAPRLVGADGEDQPYRRRLPGLPTLLADRMPPLRLLLRGTWRRYRYADRPLDEDGMVEQPAAACLLLRRDMLTGWLFDERFRLFFNDTDLAHRLHACGHCLYLGSLRVCHIGGASIDEARQRNRAGVRREYDAALLAYARKNVRGWLVLAPVVVVRRALATLAELRRTTAVAHDATGRWS